MTKEEFVAAYTDYMKRNDYSYHEWDVEYEWERFKKDRSWFKEYLKGEK